MSFFDRQGIPKALLREPGVTRIAYEDAGAEDEKEGLIRFCHDGCEHVGDARPGAAGDAKVA